MRKRDLSLTPGQHHCGLPSSLGILPGATEAAPDSAPISPEMEKKVQLPCLCLASLHVYHRPRKEYCCPCSQEDTELWTCTSLLLIKQRKWEGVVATRTKPACKIHIVTKCKRGWICMYVCVRAQYWGFLPAAFIQLFLPISDFVSESWEKSTLPIPRHDSPSLQSWVQALPPKSVLVRTLHL